MTSMYLDGLNQKQREAVSSKAKYLQILAGPGSGKTHVLTTRIAYIVKHFNIPPTQILVTTFTRKAAREMRERLEKEVLLGPTLASQLNMGTFHSVCAQYLRQHGTAARLSKNFRIIEPQESIKILEKLIEERLGSISIETRTKSQSIKGMAGEFQSMISKAKNKGLTADLYTEQNESNMHPAIHDGIMIFQAYAKRLSQEHLVDFEDLLLYGCDLFKHHPQVTADIKHILVDEFQDTNRVQYDIVYHLCGGKTNITVVGDPDQSIYGFRNAYVGNFKLMTHDFKGTEVVNLEQNYRSTALILESAFQVIQKDPERIAKGLFTKNSRGTPLALLHCRTETDEGNTIAAEISRIVEYSNGLVKYKDIAVLVRMHYLTQNIESTFKVAEIPYEIVGGVGFFHRTEVQDLVSYIHFIFNPNDTISFERIINTPPRGVAEQTMKKLSALSRIQDKSVLDVLKDLCAHDFTTQRPHPLGYVLAHQAVENIKQFVALTTAVKEMVDTKGSVEAILNYVIVESCYEAHLRKNYKDHDIRWENVGELISVAHSHDTTLKDGKVVGDMDAFIARTALDPHRDDTSPEAKDKVQMMTIHAAKGLEWPCVFIAACEDSILPHIKSENENEERRLMYVAMTRAKCFLYSSYVHLRLSWGQPKKTSLSPFLAQLEETFYQRRTPAWTKESRDWVASVLHIPAPEEKDDGSDNLKATDHHGDEFPNLNSFEPRSLLYHIFGSQISESQILASQTRASQTLGSQTVASQLSASLVAVSQTPEPEIPDPQTSESVIPGPQTPELEIPGPQTSKSQKSGQQTPEAGSLEWQLSGSLSPDWETQEPQTLESEAPEPLNDLKREREYDDLADYDFSDYDLTDDEHLYDDFEVSYDSDFGISDDDDQKCSVAKKARETTHDSI